MFAYNFYYTMYYTTQTCIATIMISVGDIGELIDAFSGASFVFYLLVFIGLVIMRFTYRHEPRPFKVHTCTMYTCKAIHTVFPRIVRALRIDRALE